MAGSLAVRPARALLEHDAPRLATVNRELMLVLAVVGEEHPLSNRVLAGHLLDTHGADHGDLEQEAGGPPRHEEGRPLAPARRPQAPAPLEPTTLGEDVVWPEPVTG